MRKQALCRLTAALAGTLAVLFISSGLYSRRSFPVQGSVSLDHAVNSSVRCAFDQGESRAFPADIHGKAAVDSVFTADTPRLFTVTAENGNITGFSLTVAGDDCSAWQRLRTPDDKTVILRIPENVTGTLQLNHLKLVLIALAAFIVFRLLSGRLIPENGVDGVFLADGLFILCVTTALFVPASRISNAEFSIAEKRRLAAFPRFLKDGKVNRAYGKELDAFFNDRFFLRDRLLSLDRTLNTFTDSSLRNTGKVIKGYDQWYFYARNNALRNYHNLDMFKYEELEQAADDIRHINSVCEKFGKKLYIFIVPDKHKIYGEYFPAAKKLYPDSAGRAEQLAGFLRKHTGVAVHYFYDELHTAKKQGLTYWKNDTHWNSFGAYIAVRKMLEILRRDYPDIPELELPVVRCKIKWAGDLSAVLQETEYPFVNSVPAYTVAEGKENTAFADITTSCPSKKYKVLFVRDSFGDQQMPMLGNQFACIRALWSDYVVETAELEHFKTAGIVIFQCAERLLPKFLEGVHQTRMNLEKGGI